jgi:hypothetical protein
MPTDPQQMGGYQDKTKHHQHPKPLQAHLYSMKPLTAEEILKVL